MYLRFVIPRRDNDSHARQGIFVAAHELRDRASLERYEFELLCTTLEWFNMHLRIPAVLKDAESARAISWFKADAHAPIHKMWELVAILRSQDVTVELLKTDKPGTLIYEDKWQVAAKPSAHDRGRW